MDRLTVREQDVILALHKGLTAKAAAVQLGITAQTVKSHLKTIYLKVGAINRIDALKKLGMMVGDNRMTPFDKRCAEALAAEVWELVQRRVIDARSPAADALLDYLNGRDATTLKRSPPPEIKS